jgi:hypothetical protein
MMPTPPGPGPSAPAQRVASVASAVGLPRTALADMHFYLNRCTRFPSDIAAEL